MDDNSIEIREDRINVEDIMNKIREHIRHRQVAGKLPQDSDVLISSSPSAEIRSEAKESVQRELSFIRSSWDIQNKNYFISSHRPHIGKFLIKGRELVHEEVRRYVDPVFFRQTEFNASAVRLLTQTSQKCADLDRSILSQGQDLTQKISTLETELTQKSSRLDAELTQKISLLEADLNIHLKNRVDAKVHDTFSQIDKDLRLELGLTHFLEDRIQKGLVQESTSTEVLTSADTNYFLFEERFRGSHEPSSIRGWCYSR